MTITTTGRTSYRATNFDRTLDIAYGPISTVITIAENDNDKTHSIEINNPDSLRLIANAIASCAKRIPNRETSRNFTARDETMLFLRGNAQSLSIIIAPPAHTSETAFHIGEDDQPITKDIVSELDAARTVMRAEKNEETTDGI